MQWHSPCVHLFVCLSAEARTCRALAHQCRVLAGLSGQSAAGTVILMAAEAYCIGRTDLTDFYFYLFTFCRLSRRHRS